MNNTINLVDEYGVDLLITYEYLLEPSHYSEFYNPLTYVDATCNIEILSAELVIAGRPIEIMNCLSATQKEFIINKILKQWCY